MTTYSCPSSPPLLPPADPGAALRLLCGQRPLSGPAQPPGEEVHHAGLAPPLPHPGHQVASGRRLPGGGLLRRLRLRLADGHRWGVAVDSLHFSHREVPLLTLPVESLDLLNKHFERSDVLTNIWNKSIRITFVENIRSQDSSCVCDVVDCTAIQRWVSRASLFLVQ